MSTCFCRYLIVLVPVLTYILNYLLTPWSVAHLEKLTGPQLVKKFPAYYETRRFIAAFTSTRHLYLYWSRSIHSIPPHPTSWRSILILSRHLRLGLPGGSLATVESDPGVYRLLTFRVSNLTPVFHCMDVSVPAMFLQR